MAKIKDPVTISEKSLQKLITMCQTQNLLHTSYKEQIQQQGYQINVLEKKITLLEICISKKKKQEH
jgi:hypothetical protein